MKKIFLITLISSFIFGSSMMDGWNNSDKEATEKAQKAEQVRLCKVYTVKIQKYKTTMRDDDLARATLHNYERLHKKYCQ